MGSSRRDPRGNRIRRGEGKPEGIEKLVEEDNVTYTGVKEVGGSDEAPPVALTHLHESEKVVSTKGHEHPSCNLNPEPVNTLSLESVEKSRVNVNSSPEEASENTGKYRECLHVDEVQDTSVPIPARREKRRKLGSTHNGSRRAERQTETGEKEYIMGQKREEGESSLLEEELGSEITAPLGEIQAEKKDEKRIHQNTDKEKENDESHVGDRKTSGISTYPHEVSDENVPFRCEGEINVQEGERVERGIQPDAKERSADTMEYNDTTPPQETSLPVPVRREGRRKMGSTRRSFHRAEVQTERGEEEEMIMGQDREEGEELSLLEDELGLETAAPSGELQAEKQKEKRIHPTTNQEKGMEYQEGDRESAAISTHTPVPSEVSKQAEHSTFSVEKEREDKEESKEEKETDQVGTYQTPNSSQYSDQAEHSTFVNEGLHTDTLLTFVRTESVEQNEAESTTHDTMFQDTLILDQLNQSEDSLLTEKDKALCVTLTDSQQRSQELEDHSEKSEEGEMRNVEENSPGEDSTGDGIFTLAEESGHDTINKNKVKEEERNSENSHTVFSDDHSPTLLEQIQNFTTAEKVQTAKLQDKQPPLVVENMPFRYEGEINVQEGEGHQGERVERGIQPYTKDISADTMEYKDTTISQETSLPVPARRERRRKMGSTRLSFHRAEVQTERAEAEDVIMQHEREEGEELLLLEDELGLDTAAPSGELQAEKQKEKRINRTTNQEKGMEYQVGDRESAAISTHTPMLSEVSGKAENSTFSVEKERLDKNERQEEREREQVGTYHTSDISDYSDEAEHSTFVREELHIDAQLGKTESMGHSVVEITKHYNLYEEIVIFDQLNQSKDTLLMEISSTLSLNLNDPTESIPELDDHAQKSKEGEIRNVEKNYPEKTSQGDVLFSLAEENGHKSIRENEEREVDRNSEKFSTGVSPGYSTTILEQSKNSITAEQVKIQKLQGTQLPLAEENIPFRCEVEISVLEGEVHQEESLERSIQPGAKYRSADTMEYEDTTLPQETSLPVPARRERKRKMGSTRRSFRNAEEQIERGEEEDIIMRQEKEAREESSLLEDELGLETAAPSVELPAEKQKEKRIHLSTNHEKGMEYQVGVRESAAISTHTPVPSEVSEQAEHSTFLVEKEREDKEESKEEKEMDQVGTYQTPDISQYSDQAEHSTFVKEELHTDTRLTFGRTESVEQSEAESTKHDNMFQDTLILDQLNQSEDSLLTEKDSALCVMLTDSQQTSQELENHSEKSEEGEMRNVEENSPGDDSTGDVLFTLAEESGHDKNNKNKEKEEERNSENSHIVVSDILSPTIQDQIQNFTTAEQVQTAKLQDTHQPLVVENMPSRCEGKINVQEEGGLYGQSDKRGADSEAIDKSADIMVSQNTSLPQDTSLPGPNRNGRRRKLGSTRKSYRRAEVQTETGEEEDVMGPEREGSKESSLLEESLGSEIAAPSEERQAEKQMEINILQSSKHSTFSVEKEVANKEREERELEQVGMYHTPDISNYSAQVENSFEKQLASISNTQTNLGSRESVEFSLTESTKYENLIEDTKWRDQKMDGHTQQLCQPKNIVHHSVVEHGSLAVPQRRRKMGSSRKGLLSSPNQGEGEQLKEERDKTEGEKGKMGEMLEGIDLNDAHKRETGIDKGVALEREIEGTGIVGENAPTIDERSDNKRDASLNVLVPQLQTPLHHGGNPHIESNSEAKITQMDSTHHDYEDPCKQNTKKNSRDVALEDRKYIGAGEVKNKEGSAVKNMKGDELVGMVDRVSHGKEAREEREAERSKKKGLAIMSSIQSPPFLEPAESHTVAGKQDKASPGATHLPAVRKKLGSRRRVWKGDRDLGQANEMGVEEDNKASAVLQRIQEVFHHWDPEEKGFITCEHMQGLSGELGLSVEELQQVFDRLDKDRDGLVTPEDFTAGFREFMQFQQPTARPAATVYQSDGSILLEEEDDSERKLFLSMLGDLRAYSLLQDQSDIWRLWVELQQNEPHLLNNLEDFVSKVTDQIKTLQQEKDSLELALTRHIQQHSVGVKELYEEMERQIIIEKERVKKESLEKSRSELAKLEEELDQKNITIQTLNAVQNRLEGNLHVLQRQQQKSGVEKQELFRANQELEEHLERIRGQLQEALSHLHALRSAHAQKPTHLHLLSPTDRAVQTEDSSRPEVLNLASNVQAEKRDISHEAVVLERFGSGLDHCSPQDRCTGTQYKARRRVISIEEDPMPDLLTGGQALPQHNQGEALWEKQRGRARGERDSLSSVSRSPSVLDLLYNVVLVGNSSVGKTCFMRRFQSGDFSPDLCATVGLDSCIQTVQVEGRRVILQLWDTAGQERYHSMTKQILRKAQGLILMYDITSSDSFLALRNWLSSIQEGAPDDVIIMLLGNKNDSCKREVSLEEGERLAREYNVHFMECSAATGANVVQAMNNMARMLKQQVDEKQGSSITLHKSSPKKKSGCCG